MHASVLGNVLTVFLHKLITVQRNDMRFGGIVAPRSGCLYLTFGVVSVLLSRFGSLFKCTTDKNL